MRHAIFSAALLAAPVFAQPVAEDLPYWPIAAREAYITRETDLLAEPTVTSLVLLHDSLASEPHIAGTPGDLRQIDLLVRYFTELGFEVEKHEFWAYLARPIAATLQIVQPETIDLPIKEKALPEDPDTGHEDLTIGWNAYSGNGDVTTEVVYVNYGTREDFAKLAELGVSCEGRIVIARYGSNYRGFKSKYAQDAGAAGLIIFTDPADAGYVKGLMYPEGGWANQWQIQRGSINSLGQPGDPLTPGIEATEHARRLDPETLDLPRIPVQPVGWAAAQEILSRMTGDAAPREWQGALPFLYRLTGGESLLVRLHVEQERFIGKSANVLATLRGTTEPDLAVIIGAHHDSWNHGASDATCGLICVLESARAFARLRQIGRRPARSIIFAAWGAEEFGIIGSTEWVESRRQHLIDNAVAYINLDMAAMGPSFNSSASPSLRRVITEATRAVPAPGTNGQQRISEVWGRGIARQGFGEMGGGSDHVGFVCHTAVASASLGGSGAQGVSYHSNYDTLAWYRLAMNNSYESPMMVTQMTIAVASRLAEAPLLPLDPARAGADTIHHIATLHNRGRALGMFPAADAIGPVSTDLPLPLARVAEAARIYADRAANVHARLLEAQAAGRLSAESQSRVSRLFMLADRAWMHEPGLPGRPWFKNLYVATDEDSGYAAWMLPMLRHAIERGDAAALDAASRVYVDVFDNLHAIIAEAARELK